MAPDRHERFDPPVPISAVKPALGMAHTHGECPGSSRGSIPPDLKLPIVQPDLKSARIIEVWHLPPQSPAADNNVRGSEHAENVVKSGFRFCVVIAGRRYPRPTLYLFDVVVKRHGCKHGAAIQFPRFLPRYRDGQMCEKPIGRIGFARHPIVNNTDCHIPFVRARAVVAVTEQQQPRSAPRKAVPNPWLVLNFTHTVTVLCCILNLPNRGPGRK